MWISLLLEKQPESAHLCKIENVTVIFNIATQQGHFQYELGRFPLAVLLIGLVTAQKSACNSSQNGKTADTFIKELFHISAF